jgi:hypothetical protein
MSLRQTIFSMLTTSTDLTDLVGDNIFYNVVPQNLNNERPSVVFALSTAETMRDLQGEVMYKVKNCNIKINAKYQEDIYDILDVVEEIINECDLLKTQTSETDDEPFWDEISQWYTLNFDFQLNDF